MQPEELALLGRVFDRRKSSSPSFPDELAEQELAFQLVTLFCQGIRTEHALIEAVSFRLQDQTQPN